MECKNIQNILIDFIEGNISEHLKVQIEDHLLNCETCRTEHKQLSQLLEELSILENENPDEQLKDDFYTMLEEEKEKISHPIEIKNSSTKKINWNFLKYAASAIIILGFGFTLGRSVQLRSIQNTEIAALRSELRLMQQNATMASLSQPTASQRLKAVNMINEQSDSDLKTIALLINTFKSDENINVRMAAANALSKYSESREVRNAFVEVLEKEEDAAMQITLINLLTQIKEKRAKKAFEEILHNNNSIPVVKEQAKEGLKVFI